MNRYGFVTFESAEDASKLLKEEVCMYDVSGLCKAYFSPFDCLILLVIVLAWPGIFGFLVHCSHNAFLTGMLCVLLPKG